MKYLFVLGAFTILMFFPEIAFAQGNTSIQGGFQWIVDLLTGDIARLVAIIGVCIIAYGMMMGFFDMRRAGMVIFGIVIVFGAAEIVDQISGG